MTELLILAILLGIWTATMRVVRYFCPGALPGLSKIGLQTPVRTRLFGPRQMLKLADIQPGWRVLEIGCGWGFATKEALRRVGEDGQLHCVEINEKMLVRCRERMKERCACAAFVVADGVHLPYKAEVFDAVIIASVLGEVRRPGELLAEVVRCLKPGAAVVINEMILDPDYLSQSRVRDLGTRVGLEVADRTGNVLCHSTRLRKPGTGGDGAPGAEPVPTRKAAGRKRVAVSLLA